VSVANVDITKMALHFLIDMTDSRIACTHRFPRKKCMLCATEHEVPHALSAFLAAISTNTSPVEKHIARTEAACNLKARPGSSTVT
jgi:hypothetical protein